MARTAPSSVWGGGGFDATSSTLPGTQDWGAPAVSADAAIGGEGPTLRARARDIARNDPWASGAINKLVDKVIGGNLRLNLLPDHERLGISEQDARTYAHEVEGQFAEWGKSPARAADYQRSLTFNRLVRLAFRHHLVDGEALAISRQRRAPVDGWQTCMELIEPDRLSTPTGRLDDRRLRSGVEMNGSGAPIAYHIRSQHPGDGYFDGRNRVRWVRLQRWSPLGLPAVLHVFDRAEARQSRGISVFAPALRRLRELNEYETAELLSAKAESKLGAFATSPFDSDALIEALKMQGSQGVRDLMQARTSYHREQGLRVGGVPVTPVFSGEKIEMVRPTRPTSNYGDYTGAVLRGFAATVDLASMSVTNNWSDVNYSSARAALNEAHQAITVRRVEFCEDFASPIFTMWLIEAVAKGRIKPPGGADFMANLPAYARHQFIGPPRGIVDPVKEAAAAEQLLQSGLASRSELIAERGGDYETVIDQIAREQAYAQSRGVSFAEAETHIDAALDAALGGGPLHED